MKKIAILRGINVGGKRIILMKDLKAIFIKLGFTDVVTYIQSGNVIFDSGNNLSNIDCADMIEKSINIAYGFEVPVIVITADELKIFVEENPFYKLEVSDITKLHLTFLKEKPSEESVLNIETYNCKPDEFVIKDSSAYIYCEEKYHKSKLVNSFFEKKLKMSTTTRNWKTVLKLLELSSL
ncbi:MAG: DUF1697 domain-containing protein [Flavobacteriaceae bacterium]|nr:DUF1697 domain-containing protein [Flavobacteriaceae bacterium]